ncbi:MAG: 16S rRNA (cytosine(1402)-N(4))-methyltransferase RsmH [Candidatus Pacearchaeota archaeon]|jgi:16S rRNA (cytosine1402-N4)-methyltransferase
MDKRKHIPVLVNGVMKSFSNLKKGSLIVDGTLGMGGHSKELLKKGFLVIGIDRDINAIKKSKENLRGFENIIFVQGDSFFLGEIFNKLKIKKADGILLDLGVSTYQLEDEKRGFGFSGKLDMRMDEDKKLNAKEIVNNYSYKKLKKVFNRQGAKVYAGEVARGIINSREESEIKTGEELLEIIKSSLPPAFRNSRKHHWATPFFRALRIEVNNDLEGLENFLNNFFNFLNEKGILSIITFHSIEDKIIKRKFHELKKNEIKVITKKPILAANKEIRENPKAKRARLWIAQKK